MSKEEDAIFVRNFSLVLVFLTVVGIIAFILAKIVYADFLTTQNNDEMVAERMAPVGKANVGEAFVMGGDETADTGQESMADSSDPGTATYGKICFSCHDSGIAGAPKLGDKGAWESRMQKGTEMMVINAINGFTGETGIMPPKGGLTALSDDDVRAAVMYMLAKLDGADSASAPAAEPAATTVAEEAPAAEAPAVAAGVGKDVYDKACFVCHATGVAGAPKLGDTAGWEPRVAQGMDTLYEHAIKGFMGESGLMPPKGGRTDFSDDDVKAAVDYMVNTSP